MVKRPLTALDVKLMPVEKEIAKKMGMTWSEFQAWGNQIGDEEEAKWKREAEEFRLAHRTPEEVASEEEHARLKLPHDSTVENHLFNIAFCDERKPISFIDNSFRQYDPDSGFWRGLTTADVEHDVLEWAIKAWYPKGKDGEIHMSLGTVANMEKTVKFAAKKLHNKKSHSYSKHLLAFRNGTVDIRTGQLSLHNSENLLTSGLDHEYDPEHTICPENFYRYASRSFGKENIEYVRAALGLVLDLNAPHKFIHLQGPSGSGKGVFLRLIQKFFGHGATTNPPNLEFLKNPNECHQFLSSRRVCIWDDLLGSVGNEVGRFYSAVENSPINARRLFDKEGYSQSFNIRYLMATTGPLQSKFSNSRGWERRVFPLVTNVGVRCDRGLEDRLEQEIPQIISWVLAMDKQHRNAILENPRRYCEAAVDYFNEAAMSTSSVYEFIEHCLEPVDPSRSDLIQDQQVDMGRLISHYKAYCAAAGRHPMNTNSFKGELRSALPMNHIKRSGAGGETPARFVYIRLIDGIFQESSNGMITCNLSNLSWSGIYKFKLWAAINAPLFPYDPFQFPEKVRSWSEAYERLGQEGEEDYDVYSTVVNHLEEEMIDTGILQDGEELTPDHEDQIRSALRVQIKRTCDDKESADKWVEMRLIQILESLSKRDLAPPLQIPELPKFPENMRDREIMRDELLELTITEHRPEWWKFELDMLGAWTHERLLRVKDRYPQSLREEVMLEWEEDGRKQKLREWAEYLESEDAYAEAEQEQAEREKREMERNAQDSDEEGEDEQLGLMGFESYDDYYNAI